jgi:hypothetical protein
MVSGSGIQLFLNAGALVLFVTGLIQPYVVVPNAFTLSLWQVCSIPPATGCVAAEEYFGCPAHASRVKAVRAFGILAVIASGLGALLLAWRRCCAGASAGSARNAAGINGTDAAQIQTTTTCTATRIMAVSAQLCTSAAAIFGLIAMAIDVSLFTQSVCEGNPAAADLEGGISMGSGPKLLIAGFVLALVSSVWGVCNCCASTSKGMIDGGQNTMLYATSDLA